MIYITRRERFSSAHKLWNPDFSPEKNLEVFGKCSNPNWHGHNYEMWVTVKGEVNSSTGFVCDLSKLSEVMHHLVIEKIDHKNLNLDADFLQGLMTSTENIAIAIWKQIEAPVKSMGATLHKIKIQETENNYVEYYGE